MTTDQETIIRITSFDPLSIQFPGVSEIPAGVIRIIVPPVHIVVRDLSLGIDLLKGFQLAADSEVASVVITTESDIPIAKAAEAVFAILPQLKELWKLTQDALKGPLLP